MTITKSDHTKYPLLLALLLVLTGLAVGMGSFASSAAASNEISVSATRSSSSFAGDPIESLAPANPIATRSTSLRRAKRWRFYMPTSRARNNAVSFARYTRDNTSPDEFTNEVDPPSYWDRSFAGDCKRKSYSRVTCFSFVDAVFDIIDENDQVIGEDTYVCTWDATVWYPVATRRSLKFDASNIYCFWTSDI